MADHRSALRLELQELLLVALGAVPGALLRWQLGLHLADLNLLANVLGAALLGFLAGLPAAPRRQLLLGGFEDPAVDLSGVVLLPLQGQPHVAQDVPVPEGREGHGGPPEHQDRDNDRQAASQDTHPTCLHVRRRQREIWRAVTPRS